MVRRRQRHIFTCDAETAAALSERFGLHAKAEKFELDFVIEGDVANGEPRWRCYIEEAIVNGVGTPVPEQFTQGGAIYESSASAHSDIAAAYMADVFFGLRSQPDA